MADKKISALDELLAPADDDLLPIVDIIASETKKITYQNLLIPKTDSAVDLGSATKFFANLYADKIYYAGSTSYSISKVSFRVEFRSPAGYDFYFLNGTRKFEIASTANSSEFVPQAGVFLLDGVTFRPKTDSFADLGSTAFFWDQTFTDELILTNVGAAAAPADKLVLSAVDLSAGNTILDMNTEGAGVVGAGTPVADRTVAIRVNGAVIYLIGSTVAS